MPQIRTPITIRVESSIISLDIDITDNIISINKIYLQRFPIQNYLLSLYLWTLGRGLRPKTIALLILFPFFSEIFQT